VTAAYLDSSAIVKLYANEEHHQVVRALSGAVITGSIARVEVAAAFFGKARTGEISIAIAQVLHDAFARDWETGRFLRISLDSSIETEAADLCARYALRGFDAVQLATANAARRAVAECTLFACFDKRLCEAAVGERFRILAVT
jgi:uncharacterized protein